MRNLGYYTAGKYWLHRGGYRGWGALGAQAPPPQPRQHTSINRHLAEQPAIATLPYSLETLI